MAVFRRWLAAEQDGRRDEQFATDCVLDLTLGHQCVEAPLVVVPVALALLVLIQKLLSGREQRLVNVVRLAYLTKKVREIVPFRETGEL